MHQHDITKARCNSNPHARANQVFMDTPRSSMAAWLAHRPVCHDGTSMHWSLLKAAYLHRNGRWDSATCPVHTVTEPKNWQSIWCYIVQLATRPSGRCGPTSTIKEIQNPCRASWRWLPIPPIQDWDRETNKTICQQRLTLQVQSLLLWRGCSSQRGSYVLQGRGEWNRLLPGTPLQNIPVKHTQHTCQHTQHTCQHTEHTCQHTQLTCQHTQHTFEHVIMFVFTQGYFNRSYTAAANIF